MVELRGPEERNYLVSSHKIIWQRAIVLFSLFGRNKILVIPTDTYL